MTPKTLMSVEEFTALPGDGMLHELHEGEPITMPPPRPRHGSCQVAIAAALRECVTARDRGTVYVESGYRLTPHTSVVRCVFGAKIAAAGSGRVLGRCTRSRYRDCLARR
ncbi:MAG: hypothetical protein DMG57_09905 [Acidobacteria bacterium]|nr:MAG: hypothetical protein DMG57_09905 [Acidobacteriota bacterium]